MIRSMGRKFGALFGFVVVGLLFTNVGNGQVGGGKDELKVPKSGFLYSAPNVLGALPNRLQYSCELIAPGPSGRRRIKCEFLQVYVRAPDAARAADIDVEAVTKKLRAQVAKDPARYWRTCAEAHTGRQWEQDPLTLEAINKACLTKTIDPLVSLAIEIAKRASKTCRIGWVNQFSETLEQVAPSQWQGTDGPRGLCGYTVTTTLTAESSGSFWDYRQVRTSLPGVDPALCPPGQKGGVNVIELQWDMPPSPWAMDCQYVAF